MRLHSSQPPFSSRREETKTAQHRAKRNAGNAGQRTAASRRAASKPVSPAAESTCQKCDRSVLSTIPPVYTTRVVPHPPYTPLGYKFPLNPCRLFLTRLKSIPPERRTATILPHREIWPLKIAGKIRLSPQKAPITPEFEKWLEAEGGRRTAGCRWF